MARTGQGSHVSYNSGGLLVDPDQLITKSYPAKSMVVRPVTKTYAAKSIVVEGTYFNQELEDGAIIS